MIRTGGEQVTILHVDDEPGFAEMTAEFLERENSRFTVETATSVSDGFDRLSSTDVDCIVSDYDMPGSNGIEFLETVREAHPNLPFILFTGKGSEEVASEAISAGATDYLQKETGTDQYAILANRIENSVEQARAQRQQQRQLDAIETAQEGISILDEDGRFIYVNEAYANLYGYDPEEMIGEHWELIYRDEDAAEIYEEILPKVKEQGRWRGQTIGLRADGSTFVEDHVLAITDQGELVCTVRDITDQSALREKFELVARASTDAFWDWDPDTDEILRSEEYLAQFGYEQSDLRDDFDWWADRIHPDDRERVLTALEQAVNDPESTYDETYRFRRKDGSYGYIRSRGYVVYDEAGEPERMVGAHIDISERKEYEQELERQNEQLGEFASIVSHDLQNPLNVAKGRLELARTECDSEHLEAAAEAIDRSLTLIDDLLTLAREGEQVSDVQSVDLAEIVDDCWRTIETADATLVNEPALQIRADASRLRQLLENLFKNAIEHGGNEVTVTVDELDDRNGFYVSDDGPGIPADERDEVFEAGYSTTGEGTGFGLNIVQKIAEAHDWDIAVTDSENGGARFEITGVERIDT